jgi:hypothetical protein
MEVLGTLGLYEHIDCILDNASMGERTLNGVTIPVYHPDEYFKSCKELDNIVILITDMEDYSERFEQLNAIGDLKDTDCYIYAFIQYKAPPYEFPMPAENAVMKIPKKLHYCWFGGKELPEQNKRWMESWERLCPDYEIIRWDESNYDVNNHPYTRQAYKEKLYSFVADFARLDIVYQHGGIYFDTDVEIIKNLDVLLYDEAFAGFMNTTSIEFGSGHGGVKHFEMFKVMMSFFDDASVYHFNGSLNMNPNMMCKNYTLRKYGLSLWNYPSVVNGMRIYPTDVFNPLANQQLLPVAYTKNTMAKHYYDRNWIPDSSVGKDETARKYHEFWQKYCLDLQENEPIYSIVLSK